MHNNDEITMLDLREKAVQISISADSKTLWVNVDGLCRLRVCAATHIEVEDSRPL